MEIAIVVSILLLVGLAVFGPGLASKVISRWDITDESLSKYKFGVKYNTPDGSKPSHDQHLAAVSARKAEQVAARRRKVAASQVRPKCPACAKPMAPTGACAKGKCPSLAVVADPVAEPVASPRSIRRIK